MATICTVAVGAPRLTIPDIDALARHAATASVDGDARYRLQRSYALVQRLAQTRTPIYGLTTGCGPLAAHPIPPERREEFQCNLIRSHALTLGAAHPSTFVRAAMAVRAHVLAQGYSGVDPA